MHATELAAAPTVSHRALVWTFVATTFLASTLLFLVQPMFAKMVLPRFGGSPAVWNTCVLFFQTTLLLGYLYANVTVRWLGARRQSILNILVMAAAGALLPLAVSSAAPEPNSSPVWWLLETLALRLGLPFFALSTMAPLVQRWYATLPVPSAANPYFLYAASNTGAFSRSWRIRSSWSRCGERERRRSRGQRDMESCSYSSRPAPGCCSGTPASFHRPSP
jgi:hypothetical protein